MPRGQRSPPHSATIVEAHSEPDMPSILSRNTNDETLINVTSRSKCLRKDESFNEPTELEQLKEMIITWKKRSDSITKQISG